jgi:hypothetical protein
MFFANTLNSAVTDRRYSCLAEVFWKLKMRHTVHLWHCLTAPLE